MKLQTDLKKAAEAFAAALVTVMILLPLLDDTVFGSFHARDLDRARLVLAGHPVFFGPEMTGGGHLPGGFFYYMLAFPLALGLGWKGGFYLMVLLCGAAAAIIWWFVRKHLSVWAAPVALTALAYSGGLRSSLMYMGNPSFLPFFACVVVVGLCLLYADLSSRRKSLWFVVGIAAGLGFQLHFTIMLFVPPLLLMQIFAPRIELKRASRGELLTGLAGFALMLLPWAIWSLAGQLGHGFGQPALGFTGAPELAPEMVSTRLNNLRNFFSERANSSLRAYRESLLYVSPWNFVAMGGALLVFQRFGQAPSTKPAALKKLTWIIGLCTACTLLPVLPLGRARFLTCGSVALVLLWPVLLEYMRAHLTQKVWTVFAAIALLLSTYSFLIEQQDSELVRLSNKENTALAQSVLRETGWDYANARTRLYFLNSHPSQTIRYVYEELKADNSVPLDPSASEPDGFFIPFVDAENWRQLKRDPLKWVARHTERTIGKGLRNGQITLGPLIHVTERVKLIGYYVQDKQNYPAHFHNRSEEYYTGLDDEIDRELAKAQASPRQTAVGLFNSCPDRQSFCRIAFVAESTDLADPSQELQVRVLGIPIAFSSPRVASSWNQFLRRPYVEFTCGGETKEVLLAATLGVPPNWNRSHSVGQLLAPFERRFFPPCTKPVESMAFGFHDSMAGVALNLVHVGAMRSEIVTRK